MVTDVAAPRKETSLLAVGEIESQPDFHCKVLRGAKIISITRYFWNCGRVANIRTRMRRS